MLKIRDSFLLSYAIGTDNEIKSYLDNNRFSDGKVDNSNYDLALDLQGTLFSLGALALCFPVGVFVASDFFYRVGKGMFFAKKYGEMEPSGLIGKVRSLYSGIKR